MEGTPRHGHLGGKGQGTLRVPPAPEPDPQGLSRHEGAEGLGPGAGRQTGWIAGRGCTRGTRPGLTSGLTTQKPCRENKRKCVKEGREARAGESPGPSWPVVQCRAAPHGDMGLTAGGSNPGNPARHFPPTPGLGPLSSCLGRRPSQGQPGIPHDACCQEGSPHLPPTMWLTPNTARNLIRLGKRLSGYLGHWMSSKPKMEVR